MTSEEIHYLLATEFGLLRDERERGSGCTWFLEPVMNHFMGRAAPGTG